jgi:3'-phosphoadenosine 5'-phosphosulfate sulfotransferase (PAPS reductase)/FAD synthetase
MNNKTSNKMDAIHRIVVWFSCGSSSAVALKLAKEKYGKVNAVYCDTGSEHESNKKFLKDVEKWTGVKIEILKNFKYANIWDVFLKEKYILGIMGAPCTKLLKVQMRKKYQKKDDIHILGYTLEEKLRAEKFDFRNPDVKTEWILIEQGLTKQDCTGLVWREGIELPEMYKLGYDHNNCIGCVKGGMGYWNKIRQDFPEHFEKMAIVEREIGFTVLKDKNGPLYLDELEPTRGNFKKEPPILCGFDCELLHQSFEDDV